MQYQTTQDRVVVEPDADSQKTVSGFILPYDDETTALGTVVLTGPGRVTKKNVTIPVSLAPGERVMFVKGSGIAVTVDGKSLLLFKEDELIGTVHSERTQST
jgi:chaperonin GroES